MSDCSLVPIGLRVDRDLRGSGPVAIRSPFEFGRDTSSLSNPGNSSARSV